MPRGSTISLPVRTAIVVLRCEGHDWPMIADKLRCTQHTARFTFSCVLARAGVASDTPPASLSLFQLLQFLDDTREQSQHHETSPVSNPPAPTSNIPPVDFDSDHPQVPALSADWVRNPPRLPEWRQRLFLPPSEVALELDRNQYNMYWPYTSNVWCKDNERIRKSDRHVVSHHDCRLRRETWVPKSPRSKPRPSREGRTCSACLKMDFDPVAGTYQLTLVQPHTHLLEAMDQLKLNNGVRRNVEQEIAAGRGAAEIFNGLSSNGWNLLREAGGGSLTKKTILNWQRNFKK